MLINQKTIDLVGLSEKALDILERPDRKIQFQLRKHTPEDEIVNCYVVYHSTARGPPAKGGIRLSQEVTMDETSQLAELMTYKNTLMNLPFGGGKSGIGADSQLSPKAKSTLIQGFTHEIREELYSGAYVPAPDIGTGPREMAEIFDETHDRTTVTGKPTGIGGLPGRREATGYGVQIATSYAAERILNEDISDLSIAVQGFGNVGFWTSKFLSDRGADIVAVSDIKGGIIDTEGFDVEDLKKHERENGTVVGYGAEEITNEELLKLDVDVLIPAAVGGVITKKIAENLEANLIVEGANAPTTSEGDQVLKEREIPLIPDILANAGGVVASYVEWRGGKSGSKTKKEETYRTVKSEIEESFSEVLEIKEDKETTFRTAAMVASVKRLKKTMKERGWI